MYILTPPTPYFECLSANVGSSRQGGNEARGKLCFLMYQIHYNANKIYASLL